MSDGYAGRHLAQSFTYPGVAEAYQYRPPYPAEVFDLLVGLISDRPSRVLDLGAGEGALARPLASRVDQVDAVDPSTAMIEAGRQRPGGAAANLRWVLGSAEDAELEGPYAMVTAGASLHWMLPKPTMSRLAQVMTAGAYLVAALRQLPGVSAVRGQGLLVAAELAEGKSAGPVAAAALDAGLVVNAVTPTALRLAPSLLVSEDEIDRAVEILGKALAAVGP